MHASAGLSSSATTAKGAPVHLDFLDGIRGCASIYVVLHHAMLTLPAAPQGLLSTALGLGHYAVDVFIVLSGYCLMLPVLRKRGAAVAYWPFIARRAVRILPAYYAAMLVSLALIGTVLGRVTGTHWDVTLPVTARDVVLHALLLHDWSVVSAPRINHVFWSVGVEWKIYFLFPLLVALFRRRGPVTTTLLALATGYVVWCLLEVAQVGNPSPFGSSPYYLGLFALGMLAAELGESERMRAPASSRRMLAAFLVLTAAVGARQVIRGPSGEHLVPLQVASAVVGAWAASLLVLLRIGALRTVASALSMRPVVAVGRFGYSLYLIHAPVLQIVYLCLLVGHPWGPAGRVSVMLIAGTAASLMAAYAFYRLAELPFHALSRRIASRTATARGAQARS